MRVIHNHEVAGLRDPTTRRFVYNCLDACIPCEIVEALDPMLDPAAARIYAFERAMQAPAMAMMLRGVRIDDETRRKHLTQLRRDAKKLTRKLNKTVAELGWDRTIKATAKTTGACPETLKQHKWPRGVAEEDRVCELCGFARLQPKPFNPNSNGKTGDVAYMLYDILGIPPYRNKARDVSVEKDILDKIGNKYVRAKPITDACREVRHLVKLAAIVADAVSSDGRMRSSFNVAATVDARWSSSENCRHEGTNLQNITKDLRDMVVPDPGMVLIYPDLAQAESRVVAYLAGDDAYIEAHKSSDVHIFVCKMLWPDLPWTDDPVKDREIADKPALFDPDHSWRDRAKRIQHALNYWLTANGLAARVQIKQHTARGIYRRYFYSFPHIQPWQNTTVAEGKKFGFLTNPLGRKRQFFGRLWDKGTQRQMIAFKPQSTVAEILNASLWDIWYNMDPERVQLLQQGHDAILAQVRIDDQDTIDEVKSRMEVPCEINGRTMIIPADMSVGHDWKAIS